MDGLNQNGKTVVNYVDKEELYNDIVNWQDSVSLARKEGRPIPQMPNSIGKAIIETAEGLAQRGNFSGYTWVDEMIGDGILAATKAIPKFDRNNAKKNPFGFLTLTIWRAFIGRIKKENKLLLDKKEMLLDENILGYSVGDYDSDIQVSKNTMIETYMNNSR